MSSQKNSIYLTKAKIEAYHQQLEYMEGTGTKKLSKLLASSPSSGMGRPKDLPAHELAGRFLGEMEEIKAKLQNAIVIDEYVKNLQDYSIINIGASVKLIDLETQEESVYTLVGSDEVNIEKGRISYLSPLGSELIGKSKDTIVILKSTGGRFKIDNIVYNPLDFTYKLTNWDHLLDNVIV